MMQWFYLYVEAFYCTNMILGNEYGVIIFKQYACFLFSDGPESVSFNTAVTSFVKNEGDQLTVHCLSSCFPSCSYNWTKQDQSGTVSTTKTLYFSNLEKRHAGSYTCTVTNQFSIINATKSITASLSVRCKYDMETLSLNSIKIT